MARRRRLGRWTAMMPGDVLLRDSRLCLGGDAITGQSPRTLPVCYVAVVVPFSTLAAWVSPETGFEMLLRADSSGALPASLVAPFSSLLRLRLRLEGRKLFRVVDAGRQRQWAGSVRGPEIWQHVVRLHDVLHGLQCSLSPCRPGCSGIWPCAENRPRLRGRQSIVVDACCERDDVLQSKSIRFLVAWHLAEMPVLGSRRFVVFLRDG